MNASNKINVNPIKLQQLQDLVVFAKIISRQRIASQLSMTYYTQGQWIEVYEKMIWITIKSMKNGKASGQEGILAELLENGMGKLLQMLNYFKDIFMEKQSNKSGKKHR